MRIVQFIIAIGRIGPAGKLIGFRRDDRPNQVFQVISMLFKVLCQCFQQIRVSRRIRGAKIIDWMDQPSPKEVRPYPVDSRFGEIWMRSHPPGKPHPGVFVGSWIDRLTIEKARRHFLLGARMNNFNEA